ncbi:MAG: tRNA (guanosine(37)-N1)-methyltransferase TrmD [Gammaproteobacteria bacterium]|nr:tRNA (guanosine(37)-N1)-methyltransferase TrmD [Gammaproteobacteria bacterium]MDH5727723.1 tRNA (guanosine(37)-N1)-methyltransferase TrmD [Gammaproteobacteria bacterium]
MRIDVVTLFPEMVHALRDYGVSGRAIERGLVELETWNPRDYTQDRHRTVDDRPYGGGPGMVMMVEPLQQAVRAAKAENTQSKVIYLSPQGQRLDQAVIQDLAKQSGLIFIAGRYEGVDERFIESCVDEELSIGDYVLSGGELAAMVVIDGIARLQPGALGHEDSAEQDSFSDGLLDCPHYTRPEVYADESVPSVLLSGDHQAIKRWRLKQALGRTWQRRPDLLALKTLSDDEQNLLDEFKQEPSGKRKN